MSETVVENATNDTPQSDVGNKTDYREMSDAQLDQALSDTQNRDGTFEATSGGSAYNSDTKSETVINPPEPTPELDGLHPSEAVTPISIDDFAEPLESYECDSLNYALAETPQGVDVLVALHRADGVVTDEVVQLALDAGVSQRQIDGYVSAQIHEANKIFNDAGLSLADGQSIVSRAKATFTPAEWQIFTDETNQDPRKSIETLKAYFDNKDR